MRRLQVQVHTHLCGLALQFNAAVLDPADMTIFWWCAARAAEQGHDIEGLICNRCAVLGRDRFHTRARKIGVRGQRCEIIVDMGHLVSPIQGADALPNGIGMLSEGHHHESVTHQCCSSTAFGEQSHAS